MKNSTSLIIYGIAAVLLAVPLVAMQFSREISWSLNDFIIAGFLLFSAATAVNFILVQVKTTSRRFISVAVILIIFILVWAELAVGIFGSRVAGN